MAASHPKKDNSTANATKPKPEELKKINGNLDGEKAQSKNGQDTKTKSEIPEETEDKTKVDPKDPQVTVVLPSKPKVAEETATANEIGWSFVQKYYHLLNKNPRKMHVFYKSNSSMLFGEEGEDCVFNIGQNQIHERFMSLNLKGSKILVTNADCLSSIFNTIIILVIGELSQNEGPTKKFVQTFLLHEMDRGFYVINDVFRFINPDGSSGLENTHNYISVESKDGLLKVTPANPSMPLEPVVTSQEKISDDPILSDTVEKSKNNADLTIATEEKQGESIDVSAATRTPINGTEPSQTTAVAPEIVTAPVSKPKKKKNKNKKKLEENREGEAETEKSTESFNNSQNQSEKLDSNTQSSASPSVPTQTRAPEKPKAWAKLPPVASTPVNSSTQADFTNKPAGEASTSREESGPEVYPNQVCLRNVKDDTPKSVINDAFSIFGTVRTIDFNQRVVFLEFTSAESATKAIAAGQVTIGGNQVYIEPRRVRPSGYNRGFYNRRGGHFNQRRGNFQGSGSSNGNENKDGWTTPRPAGRNYNNRVNNPQ